MEWTTNMEGGGTLYFRDDGSYYYFEANYPLRREEKAEYQVILQGVQGGQLLGTMTPSEHGLKLSRMVSRTSLEKWGCLPVTKVICQKQYPFMEGNTAKAYSLNHEIDVKENHLPEYDEGNETSSKKENVEEWESLAVAGEKEKINPINTQTTRELTGKDLVIGEKKRVEFLEEKEKIEEKTTEQREEWLPLIWDEEKSNHGFSPCSQPWKEVESSVISSLLRHSQGVLRREDKEGFTLAIPYFTDKEFPLTPIFCFGVLTTISDRKHLLFSFSKEGKPLIISLA